MAWYDFSVGDYGLPRVWDVQSRGRQNPGSLVGAIFSARFVPPPNEADGSPATEKTTTDGFEGLADGQVMFAPASDDLFDAEGEWTLHLSYTLGDGGETLDPILIRVGPQGSTASGSVSGASTGSGLQAQLDALTLLATEDEPLEIVMGPGTYHLTEPIDLRSYVTIRSRGIGGVRFTGSFAGKSDQLADTDDAANALFVAESELAGGSTTLSARGYPGATSLSLTSAAGISVTAGCWLLLSGSNATLGDEAPGDSDTSSLVMYEVVQVSDAYVSGNTVPLAGPLRYHRASGYTVRRFSTVVIGAGLDGIELDCRDENIAVGVLGRSAIELSLRRLKLRGFSRSAIHLDQGARDTDLREIRGAGQNNGLVHCRSAHDTHARDLSTDPRAERYHPATTGVPRPQILEREACVGGKYEQVDIARACAALGVWGSKDASYRDFKIRDLDATQMRTRMIVIGEQQLNGKQGVAVWMGNGVAGVSGFAEFAQRCAFSDFVIENVVSTLASGDRVVWYHDIRYSQFNGLVIGNKGLVADMTYGLEVHDVLDCTMSNYTARGVSRALAFQNDPAIFTARNIHLNGAAGEAATLASDLIYFNCTTARAILLDGVKLTSVTAETDFFGWGSGFAGEAHSGFELRNIYLNIYSQEWQVGRAVMANNQTGTAMFLGQAAQLDAATPSGDRRVLVPTGKNTRCVPVLASDGATTGYVLVQDPAEGGILLVTGATAPGDLIENNGADQLWAVNNTLVGGARPPYSVARSLMVKGATAGYVATLGGA